MNQVSLLLFYFCRLSLPGEEETGEEGCRGSNHLPPVEYSEYSFGSLFLQARETLAEIPEQFLSYMRTNGIRPNPPPLKKQQSGFINPYGAQGGPPQAGKLSPQL